MAVEFPRGKAKVNKANNNIASLTESPKCRISNIEFIEQDESNAIAVTRCGQQVERIQIVAHVAVGRVDHERVVDALRDGLVVVVVVDLAQPALGDLAGRRPAGAPAP